MNALEKLGFKKILDHAVVGCGYESQKRDRIYIFKSGDIVFSDSETFTKNDILALAEVIKEEF